MIPIRDVIPSRTTPYVTFSLIIANALAFLCLLPLDPASASRVLETYGLVPAHLTLVTSPTLLTAAFLHGGWAHLLGNLLFLWIFGDNVEDRFGHRRFLAFYVFAALAGNLAQVAAEPGSLVPIVGASGAIAGVMGAYFVLFPRSRIVMLIWLIFYVDFVEIPAVLFLGVWFLLQLVSGVGRSATVGAPGIAFVAHVGGFAVGALCGRLLAKPERAAVDWWDPPIP